MIKLAEALSPKLLSQALAEDADAITQLKGYLSRVGELLLGAFEQGARIEQIIEGRAHSIDLLLQHLWNDSTLAHRDDVCLIAVGGYGRKELHPFSDIDILILCQQHSDGINEALESLITLLWDIGLKPGHSLRTLEECSELAKSDITVMTNLIESRLLTGPYHLLDELRYGINSHNIWSSKEFFRCKREEQRQRHTRFHSTSYSIEPNLKESPGGLRDIQTVSWIAKRHFNASGLYELTHLGVFSTIEYRTLSSCLSFLWKVRFALHTVANRSEERLLFDHQKKVAEMLGYTGSSQNAAVEAFMKKYFRTVMKVRDLNDLLLQVFEQEILKMGSKLPVVKIDHQFQLKGDHIETVSDQVFVNDPPALLRLFKVFVEYPEAARMSATTLRLVTENKKLIDDAFRQNPDNQKMFIDFFRTKGNLARALVLFKRSGILGAYLPAFLKIAGQMQFDMFHIYTVDEHTLFLLRNLAHFSEQTKDNPFPFCQQIMATTPHPEIIYLAGLFHDIAKGRGGDHSTLGAVDARIFCNEHGLPKEHTDIVVWLVENHLLMSVTAQKQDISDPEVVSRFADKVKDHVRLEFLYVLTVADIRATNPSLWNGWKDALLRELYLNTKVLLMQGQDNHQTRNEYIDKIKAESLSLMRDAPCPLDSIEAFWSSLDDGYFLALRPEQIAWQTQSVLGAKDKEQSVVSVQPHPNAGGTEIFLYTRDKAKLFASVTSFLNEQDLSIQAASIHTTNQYCLDSFVVLNNDNLASHQDHHRLETALLHLLDNMPESLPEAQQRRSRQSKSFDIETEVRFTQSADKDVTIMELFALEQPGLLSLIGRAFYECGVHVRSAKIVTLGERVEDIFTICDHDNKPVIDESLQNTIRKSIESLIN